tara:strand:- start:761 stop:1438 length:678 start_codon:yes stop_codon:yes gene_type:complete
MKQFIFSVFLLLKKDLLIDYRRKDLFFSLLIFSLLVIFIFDYILGGSSSILLSIVPALFWIAVMLGGALGMSRALSLEIQNGAFYGVLVSPVHREAIFLAKVISMVVLMLFMELILVSAMIILFDFWFLNFFHFLSGILLTTIGVATVGVFVAYISGNTTIVEAMMPLLFFPIVLPLIVGGVEIMDFALWGGDIVAMYKWLGFIFVFDMLFLTVCSFSFGLIVRE